jgi:excisionase family DNA binding protein
MSRSIERGSLASQDNATPDFPHVNEDATILSSYPLALTVIQAAEILGITPSRCRELLRRGLLPGLRLGNLWRVPRARLEALLAGEGQ